MRIYSSKNRLGVSVTAQWAGFISCALLCPVLAYDRTTEAGEAAIDDPTIECQPYSYSPVTASLPLFPPIWETASILPNDSLALSLWNSISGDIPDIPVKGKINGDFSHVFPTYPTTDPDCWWTYGRCVTPKRQGLPPDVYQVPEPRTLGYGFDDGPNCSHNAFYDFLSSNDQRATMFYIGSNVMNWPREAQRALADGHEVCVHTWSHHYMTAFTSEDAFAELYYSMCISLHRLHGASSYEFQIQAIKLVTSVVPTCWRPPFGDIDDRIRAIAELLGLRTIMWGYDSNDWRAGVNGVTATDVDAYYQRLLNDAKLGEFDAAGPIILTHELNNFTMSEAIKFYPQLRAAFDHIKPVGGALNWTNQDDSTTSSAYSGELTSNTMYNPPSTPETSTTTTNTMTLRPAFDAKNDATSPYHLSTSTLLALLSILVIT